MHTGAVRARNSLSTKEALWGYIFVAPIFIGFLVFTCIPVIVSFYYSLTKYDGLTEPTFNGINNYVQLATDAKFLASLGHTLYFTLGTVPLDAGIALIIAIVLNLNLRLKVLYRTAFFIPVVTSTVAVAEVWKWLYSTDYGLINGILSEWGLYQPPWLTSDTWAMPSVMLMSIWKHIGFNMIIFLAGLQGISVSLYEAAKIDGAGAFKRFIYITVPLLRHTTLFVLVLSTIRAIQVFDQVYIMTAGGPASSTTTVVYWIYQNAFQFFKQGYASAMAYVLFAIIFIATMIQMKFAQRKDVN
ncbi:multiple sugar transport system permease protein [Paenibacillus sp. 1_12]|uniref:carbohydrate ABC transporter permease n=1 Tax=Paenibacillus sp. 1_12 TaxID=1566278 RepID=UPI0008E62686|nr:sugar ABC transporter permease [Paenibacillus sp. 1_12]SFM38909.1 multiple sugar transport system permease protein [Paenibacillus sp. 1_12]